jgi:23S rRNA pseudouridine1911/1915/1917 synthase
MKNFVKPNVKIIAEEKDYLIINKPAGLIVHKPRHDYQKPTLTDWLIKKYPEIKLVGDEPQLRPGIVHRLDRQVSGLMVVARNQKAFDWLKDQFKKRKVLKEYLALVYGQIKKNEAEINLPLQKGAGKTIVKPKDAQAELKPALTYFEVLERFQHYTLLKIRITTGRTHQIRAHLANYGHSVVGDTKYCHRLYRNRKAFTKFIKSDRVFLHSHHLSFHNQNGRWQEYKSDLPQKLQKFLVGLT